MKTYAELNASFKRACLLRERMQYMSPCGVVDPEQADLYWRLCEELKENLRDILAENFLMYSKPRLIKFLSMCSTYAVVEPFKVLLRVALLFEENYP